LIEHQNFNGIKFDEAGKSDAISGATIMYSDVVDLFNEAKKAGPQEAGDFTNGVHYAEDAKADDKGYIHTLAYFVNDGRIIAAHVDAYKLETVDGKPTKQFKTDLAQLPEGDANKYSLAEGSVAPYNEQANAVSKWIVDNQGFGDASIDSDGKTDAISSATITISNWVDLFNKLKG
jgi:major membrane immunogen (membrane-anchored lipoprotein)